MSWTGEPGPQGPPGTPFLHPLRNYSEKVESNTEWKIAMFATNPEFRTMYLTAWKTPHLKDSNRIIDRMAILWHQTNGTWTLDEGGDLVVREPDWYSDFPCWPPPIDWLMHDVNPPGPPGDEGAVGCCS